MKRITLFFVLLAGLGLTSVQAQTCSKSASAKSAGCCKKSASVATADKAHCAGTADAAAKLASLDASIETRTCEKSGTVSYVRKETNPETGAVVFTSVQYDSALGKFVNCAPGDKSCCKGEKAASCCTGKAKATSADASSNDQIKQTKAQKGS